MSVNDREAKAVTPERALAILEAYGAEPARWPEADRDGMRARLALSPGLAARRAEEAALDRLLAMAPMPAPAPALKARILAAAGEGEVRRGEAGRPFAWLAALWPFGPPWQPASALVAAAVLGLIVGATLDDGFTEDDYAVVSFGLIADSDPLP